MMDRNFTWTTSQRDEKAILYNNYLYRLKRKNQDGSAIYICIFKWCSRTLTLKNNAIIKSNCDKHNRDPKLPENIQRQLCELKRRILTDIDQPITQIYEEEVKKICKYMLFTFIEFICMCSQI